MAPTTLERTTFETSRAAEYFNAEELAAQTGQYVEDFTRVVLKELMDNALDACEEANAAPEIRIIVNQSGITVEDNGPGIPEDTVKGVLDFAIRVSSREAYMAPDRGAIR